MAVYTVHQPPLRAGAASPEVERFIFVRDGFYLWAFLLGPLWMLWRRMWLVLLGYVLLWVGLSVATRALGASPAAVALVGLLIALLIGLEASTLRRFTLRRRGYANVGVVSGDDLEDAERRFFDAWLKPVPAAPGVAPPAPRSSDASPPSPPPPPPRVPPVPRGPHTPDVIGLFPEPGTP